MYSFMHYIVVTVLHIFLYILFPNIRIKFLQYILISWAFTSLFQIPLYYVLVSSASPNFRYFAYLVSSIKDSFSQPGEIENVLKKSRNVILKELSQRSSQN